MDKLKMMTMDKVQANIEKIRALFPNAVTEVLRDGKVTLAVDFDVLKQELADTLIDDRELRYQFTWPDKQKAVLLANTPIDKTLRPCKEESVDFDTTQNLYIEGDNLEVLKLLQETYLGKVKMIYIDPPYNTGNDFVYNDDFAQDSGEYLENSGQFDEQGNRLFQNTESNGRFHTDWLNMIYPRLKVAKELLTEDGVICISLDENEISNLRKVCNEIFGEQNFINTFSVKRGKKSLNSQFSQIKSLNIGFEYIVVYAKSINFGYTNPFEEASEKQKQGSWAGLFNSPDRPTMRYQIGNITIDHGQWKWSKEKGLRAYQNWLDFVAQGGTEYSLKEYWERNRDEYFAKHGVALEFVKTTSTSASYWVAPTDKIIMDTNLDYNSSGDVDARNLLGNIFSAPKPTKLIKKLVDMLSDKKSLILDFFSGSATTAHAVMQLNAEDGGNRKFILVQLPEVCDEKSEAYKAGYKNICEIGKERIRRAGAKIKAENGLTAQNLDIGFRVLKLDSSNMQPVYYHPEAYKQTLLDDMTDNIKADRTPLDLLFQVMLDLGKPLSAKIEEREIAGKHIFIVNDDDLIACFDSNITEETVKAIAQLKPLYAVFRDSSLADDSTAANFDQIFATYSPNTVRKVL